MATHSSLPDPDPAALERSHQLVSRIRSAIHHAGGVIGFDHFMQMALYEPGLGYYTAAAPIFGTGGDFVTAPEAGDLFACCLARQCSDILAVTGGGIVEYGAGSGRLACDLLRLMCAEGAPPPHYLIIEPSAALAERQRALLAATVPAMATRLRWCETHPDHAIEGVVIANEVLDAMPVKRFVVQRGQAMELGVAVAGEAFTWSTLDRELASDPAAGAGADVLAGLPDGYVSECNAALGPWLAALREVLTRGVVLLSDYGYPRHEYLHPSRSSGTLKCHFRQHVHGDPFLFPGLQDVTAAVDFNAVAEQAATAGFTLAGYTSQTHFLIACGVQECLQAPCTDARQSFARAQEAKLLLLPGEMGQTCKFMALTVDYAAALRGFQHDQRHRLSAVAV